MNRDCGQSIIAANTNFELLLMYGCRIFNCMTTSSLDLPCQTLLGSPTGC
ncbi:hypothetical protein ACSQ6I_00630 [Anabaena sp. WFMT]